VALGKSINEVSNATLHASLREVAACPDSIRVLSRTCTLDSSIDPRVTTEATVIANQSKVLFSPTAA
jgi:hypothetical protein